MGENMRIASPRYYFTVKINLSPTYLQLLGVVKSEDYWLKHT